MTERRANEKLGKVFAANLDLLHMCDRRACEKLIRSLFPLVESWRDLIDPLKETGSIALARAIEEMVAEATP